MILTIIQIYNCKLRQWIQLLKIIILFLEDSKIFTKCILDLRVAIDQNS